MSGKYLSLNFQSEFYFILLYFGFFFFFNNLILKFEKKRLKVIFL